MSLTSDKPMPALMTLLDVRRPRGSWPWITFLLGIALGWILHSHLS